MAYSQCKDKVLRKARGTLTSCHRSLKQRTKNGRNLFSLSQWTNNLLSTSLIRIIRLSKRKLSLKRDSLESMSRQPLDSPTFGSKRSPLMLSSSSSCYKGTTSTLLPQSSRIGSILVRISDYCWAISRCIPLGIVSKL